MERYLSPKARQITPYVPGEQPQDKRYIKLNTNENPYPPSPKALEAIERAASGDLRLYTRPEMDELRDAIARVQGLPDRSWVYCGNGSDEVLALSFQAFFGGEQPLLFPDITYSFYPVYCDLYSIAQRTVPLAGDFTIRLADYDVPACGAVFPNPNAPTGIFHDLADIEAYLTRHDDRVLLVDEAYVRFGNQSMVPLLAKHPNLVVVTTLSKSHALAGLRCGIVMAQPHLIDGVIRIKNSFNSYPMSAMAQAGATAAILDDDYAKNICAKVAATRDRVRQALVARGFAVTPSTANLLFFRHNLIAGPALFAALRQRGILVRRFDNPARIADYIRMTIGTDEDMDRVLAAIDEILAAN